MNFGQRLRKLRENRKITQKELSKVLNVSESAIGMYERGEREPNFETMDKIASFFNVPTDYLLGRTNSLPSTIEKKVQVVRETSPEYMTERDQLLKELEQYGNLAFQGGGEDLTDDELREIVKAMRDAAKTAARNTYNVISKFKK